MRQNINPMNSKLMPWQMAQARKAVMEPICNYLSLFGEYWRVWESVYTPTKTFK